MFDSRPFIAATERIQQSRARIANAMVQLGKNVEDFNRQTARVTKIEGRLAGKVDPAARASLGRELEGVVNQISGIGRNLERWRANVDHYTRESLDAHVGILAHPDAPEDLCDVLARNVWQYRQRGQCADGIWERAVAARPWIATRYLNEPASA